MQYESERDPLVDWKTLWDRYANPDIPLINTEKRNLLNVGFGGIKLDDSKYADDLVNYNEITMDIDKKYSPDIICDILDMSAIPTYSVDCVYACHVLEYVDYLSVPKVLMQFKRILKPNGFARIIVTNIKVAAMYLIQDKLFNKLPCDDKSLTPYKLLYPTDNNHVVRSGYTAGVIAKFAKDYNLSLETKEVDNNLLITLYND